MRQLVTGGAGFIGSNYIFYLLNKYSEDKIYCLDSLTYAGNYHTIEKAVKEGRVKFFNTDITDKKEIDRIFKKYRFDVVVNFAAESHVDRSIDDSSVFLNTNVIGTQVLLDSCLLNNVDRFHQVSTDEVYGDLSLDEETKFIETSPLSPSSPYSVSKAAADLLVLSYFRTHQANVTISRCSNNYGPYQFPEKLIPLMIINSLSNKKLPLYGDGLNVRDWLFVEDHCEAIDLIIRDGKSGEVYNIGGNNEKSNISIVLTILSELNKSNSLIEYIEDRKGHDRRYAIDTNKIKQELGWIPKTDFSQGLVNTIQWYIDNKYWWEKIINEEYINYYKKKYKKKGY